MDTEAGRITIKLDRLILDELARQAMAMEATTEDAARLIIMAGTAPEILERLKKETSKTDLRTVLS